MSDNEMVRNSFDIRKYKDCRLTLKEDDEIDVFDMGDGAYEELQSP